MAKDSNQANEINDDTAETSPYINEDANSGSRFGWVKLKPAKITAIAVGGALALGAAFAGGAVVGKITTFNNGPAIGLPFEGGEDQHEFGKRGHFGGGEHPEGQFQRPPHGPQGERWGEPGGEPGSLPTPTDPEVQSN